jgi:hypothetical protein
VLIVAYASHKKKSYSFFLLQVGPGLGGWSGADDGEAAQEEGPARERLFRTPSRRTLRHLPDALLPPPPPRPPLTLQSEYGDIYKATLAHTGDAATCLTVKYFDTLPPAASLAVLKTGFLFAASEFGSHALYQFIVRGGGGGPGGGWVSGAACRLVRGSAAAARADARTPFRPPPMPCQRLLPLTPLPASGHGRGPRRR